MSVETRRTAILLSGMPREVDETWRTFRDNLYTRVPNPDVFIYSGQHYPVGPEFFGQIQPKKYKIEDQIHHYDTEQVLRKIGYYDIHHLNSYCQQIYGIKKACELKKEYEDDVKIKYDLVIRTRPDFIWLRPINLDWLELDKISNLHPNFSPTICAEFAIGPNAEMEKYCGIYDWILNHGVEHLTKNSPRLNYSHCWNCDVILTAYLFDYLKLPLGTNERIPMDFHSPYDYYRIMNRHKRNQY